MSVSKISKEELTRRRESLGLSKSAFAREAGLHSSTVTQVENGHFIPYESQMKKIVSALERLEAAQVK